MVRAADCRSAGPWFKSGCALFCTPPYLRTSKTEIEAVRHRKLSTRAEPICCAKARACFRKNFDDSIFLLTERMCSYVPPWPNGQGVGLLIRRLRVRVPQEVCCAIVLIFVAPKSKGIATQSGQGSPSLLPVVFCFVDDETRESLPRSPS